MIQEATFSCLFFSPFFSCRVFRIVVHKETRTRGILKCKLLINFDINSASSNGRKREINISRCLLHIYGWFFFISGRGNSFMEMYELKMGLLKDAGETQL